MQYRITAPGQLTPDDVEILRIWRDARPDGTPIIRVLFQTPTAVYGESIYQAVILDFGAELPATPNSRFFFEHYASEDGTAFDSLYYRRLPGGYNWAKWAQQLQLDVADVAA